MLDYWHSKLTISLGHSNSTLLAMAIYYMSSSTYFAAGCLQPYPIRLLCQFSHASLSLYREKVLREMFGLGTSVLSSHTTIFGEDPLSLVV